MNVEEQEFLLKLARNAIKAHFEGDKVQVGDVVDNLKKERATFVTLTINGQLRGCIGHLCAVQELYKDVIENAVFAAFRDSRFPALTEAEFVKVHIEISILSKPEEFLFDETDDLLDKLSHDLGVILSKNGRSATFLPQVWEQIPVKEEFLTHLCMKAGLAGDEWKREVEIKTYTVNCFKEE
jgi:AmmeMemoRadiSam system protein A